MKFISGSVVDGEDNVPFNLQEQIRKRLPQIMMLP
jgi:hypothetical protein